MSSELCYYGKIGDLSYLDRVPWRQFVYHYKWLCDVKKKEKEAHERSQKEQKAAMSAARSRGSTHRRR
jgi:hypothetical protein